MSVKSSSGKVTISKYFHSLIWKNKSVVCDCSLKKIQKKKGERRAAKEKEMEALRAQGVDVDTGTNLLEDEDETDLLFTS